MLKLRTQLAIAAAAVSAFWIAAAMFGWGGWSTYPAHTAILQFALAALVQISLWISIVLAAGALFTHILIVRDNELYEPADADSECDCGEGCCQPADQSNISS